ncbi:MAG: mannose-1-phosphate guanylyltransferase, partial [Calditrichaeota bacterium]
MNAYAVLMAGGVGTRFWPRSRRKSPKQVLRIFGEESLIQATYNRLSGLVDDSRLYVVTSREQKQMIHEQLPHLSEENFLLEPVGRNTAPCIGLAAIHIAAVDPEAVMIVLPADHLITEVETFRKVIRLAVDFAAQNDGLVTLGIHPTEPATGYGYIQAGEEVYREGEMPVFKVKTFAEKPNLETARRFLESGDFYWNSGMFIWKASTILQEISDKLPEIYEALQEVEAALNTPRYSEQVERMYRHIKGISIDFGVMQQAREVYVIPVEMGWNDVGSWETVYSISPKDKHLNAGEYDTLINIRSGKNYVYSP